MSINFQNFDNLDQFIKDNIILINEKIGSFSRKKYKESKQIDEKTLGVVYTSTDISPYLSKKFSEFIRDPQKKSILDSELNMCDGSKKDFKEIANTHFFKVSDVEDYYKQSILKEIKEAYLNSSQLQEDVLNKFLSYHEYIGKDLCLKKNKYIKPVLKKLLNKTLFMGLSGGFSQNITSIDFGTMSANAGDSAQFIFLGRAILAGFNCSNVDVRSSRYDAIIDHKGHLLRVQVKGISGTSISLKDRDRGGEGIDTSSPRNTGLPISSKDCDIYVAVDKQIGICYLIPTWEIDNYVKEGKASMALTKLESYKENWAVIEETEKKLFS